MSVTGRKTKRIKYNLFERGRQHSGKNRANVDMKEMINQINHPKVQEMIKTGTMYGYNGHEIRRRYGIFPPESTLIDGKVVYLEPAFRTLESYVEENGDVTHVAEFFENEAGEYARKQYLGRAGSFSSAQDYRRAGLSLVLSISMAMIMSCSGTTQQTWRMASCSMDLQYQNSKKVLFPVLTARQTFPCYHPLKR